MFNDKHTLRYIRLWGKMNPTARFDTIFAKMANLATVNFATALFGKMDKIISGFLLHNMPTFSLGCI